MKLYFVLFAVLVASASAGRGGKRREQYLANMKDCVQETGVTVEEFKKSFHDENPSHAVKCTVHCIAKKMGMLTGDESIDINKMLEKFGKNEKKAAAIKQCDESTKGESDKCHRTFAFKKCMKKEVGFGKGRGGNGGPPEDDENDNA